MPMLRFVRSRSTRIFAMTGIAEIDMAVAMKRLNRMRLLGSARYERGHEVAEAEAEPERQDHPHHRRDEGGRAEVAQEAHVGLEAREEQQHRHADGAEGVEQVEALVRGREDPREAAREPVPEPRGPERDARPRARPRRPAGRGAWRPRRRGARPRSSSDSCTSSRNTACPARGLIGSGIEPADPSIGSAGLWCGGATWQSATEKRAEDRVRAGGRVRGAREALARGHDDRISHLAARDA